MLINKSLKYSTSPTIVPAQYEVSFCNHSHSIGNDVPLLTHAHSSSLNITHSENDYHADHKSLSLITKVAVSHYIPILYCDTLMGINFNPNYYVDITDYYELKKDVTFY